MYKVQLRDDEVDMAKWAGNRRFTSARQRGIQMFHYGEKQDADPIETDELGAGSELAVAKLMNMYWDAGLDTRHVPDVGHLFVRHTKNHRNRLIIRPEDSDGVYVLVTGIFPTFHVHGWMHSDEARANPFYEDDFGKTGKPPAQAVPSSDLHNMAQQGKVCLVDCRGQRFVQ